MIVATHEAPFTLGEAIGVTRQHHQMLRLPRTIPRDPVYLWAYVSRNTFWESDFKKTLPAWTWNSATLKTRAGGILGIGNTVLLIYAYITSYLEWFDIELTFCLYDDIQKTLPTPCFPCPAIAQWMLLGCHVELWGEIGFTFSYN